MIADVNSRMATLTMPSYNLTIEAAYVDKCTMNEEERRAGIMYIIEGMYDGVFLYNEMSAQHWAAEWLIEEDELYVCPDELRRVMQRYILSVIYLSMEGSDWNECFAGDDECGRESRSVFFGKSAYLSSADECKWAGSTCDNESSIIGLEFGKKT